MEGTVMLLAAALSLPTTGLPAPEWDGGASQSVEDAAAMPLPVPDLPQPPAGIKPMKVPRILRREEGARDPKEGRSFRRVPGRGMGPVGPSCPDGSDPPCQETPYPHGNPPQGGYYYGLYRGPDGKLRYGKLYLPSYGPFEGGAHNDPPALVQPPQLMEPKTPPVRKRGKRLPVQE